MIFQPAPVILAQFNALQTQTPAVPMLDDPPALIYYTVEWPWGLVAVLAGLGVVALLGLNARGQGRKGLIACGVCFGWAMLVFVLASVITTGRERLRDRTRELIEATAKADTTALRPMLGENVQLRAPAGAPLATGRDMLLDRVKQYPGERFQIASLRMSDVQAVIDGENVARSQLRVWVRIKDSAYDLPIGSWWRIDWRRDPVPSTGGSTGATEYGPWRATGLTALQIDGLGAGSP